MKSSMQEAYDQGFKDGRVYMENTVKRLREAREELAHQLRNAALEEAAKVKEIGNLPSPLREQLAAAIRALKDKP